MGRRSAILLVACLVLAAPAAGDNGKLGKVQARIDAARKKEARLTAQINDATSSIRALESKVGDVSRTLSILERDLTLHELRLDKLDQLYAFESDRLNFLRRAYAKAWRHEIGAELRDSVLIQKYLFSSAARMDRVVSAANARPEFSRILVDYASGRLSYRAARRRLLWHFPRLLPRLARIALGAKSNGRAAPV